MLHEKAGKHGARNTCRHQVAQSWLNRLYNWGGGGGGAIDRAASPAASLSPRH